MPVGWLATTHEQRFAGPRGHLFLEFNRVSDDEYFDDFGTSLDLTSRRYLQQRADARYYGDLWNVRTLLQGYQTVDDTIPEIDQPYDRLPQVSFNAYTPRREGGLNLDFLTETSYFNRTEETVAGRTDIKPVGGRIDIKPVLSVPFHTAAGYREAEAQRRVYAVSAKPTGHQDYDGRDAQPRPPDPERSRQRPPL